MTSLKSLMAEAWMPLADKLLVCSALICFIELGQVPAWMVIIIISREFIISGFRLVASDNGVVIAASYWGKFKTTFQMIAIVLLILNIPALSMVTELISVGTELLLGNIVNTNAQYLAEQCALLGLTVYYQSTVGDNRERLAETIQTPRRGMRGDPPALNPLFYSRWQAAKCPGSTSLSSGFSRAQSGQATGQRSWKGQPEGRWIGLGISPRSS